jgi:acetoin:2,6-dichlorophenolindophenol oxidoreductase subunit alpha
MAKTNDERNTPQPVSGQPKEGYSLISDEKLIAIYTAMTKFRMIESRAQSLFQHGKLTADFHVSAGREASAAAVVIDLRPQDSLSLSLEDRMPSFAKGASLESTFRLLAVAEGDRNRGRIALDGNDSRRLNIIQSTDSAKQIHALLESAQAAKEKDEGSIVTVFFSTDPQTRTAWNEAMTTAGSKRLPVIFVHHLEDVTALEISAADAFVNGIPAIVVDGGDAVALYRVACETIARARQGRGPTCVECTAPALATALGEDCVYKSSSQQAVASDPILNIKAYLKQKELWDEETARQIVTDFNRELDLATRFLND